MKYLFVFLTLVIGVNSMAQSKKEQIAILTNRLDSLNKEYIKDTTYLSNTVETIDREYTIMSMQYEEAQELIKKKSVTISEKTNTIKSLNKKNMQLMEDSKKHYETMQELQSKIKVLEYFRDSVNSSDCVVEKYHIHSTNWEYADGDLIYLNDPYKLFTGTLFDYYENNQLKFEANYKDGKLDGQRRNWHENGQLMFEINYKNGVAITEKSWDANGNKKE